jgi:hypothetical protein
LRRFAGMALFRFDWKAVLLLSALLLIPRAHAQWLTQTFELKAGWNSVYLHVDLSHATLTELIDSDDSNPIREVWLWEPSRSTQQFVDGPQSPTPSGTQWVNWKRELGPSSRLQRLGANLACLILVDREVPTYLWQVKGRPALPRNDWTVTGLNFIGFPTHATTPPFWEAFLAPAPELQNGLEVWGYSGGELGPGNPAKLFAFRTTPLRRGQAFWIRSTGYNRYFGPFQIQLANSTGLHFRDSSGQSTVRLRNMTQSPLTVTLQQVTSEAAPAGQKAIAGPAPVLVRGELNTTNLTYDFSRLADGPQQWTLAPHGQPGAEMEVVLGVKRTELVAAPGTLYASVLRFTDSLGLSLVDVALSAEVPAQSGLWVGEASVTQVSAALNTYALATNSIAFTNLLVSLGSKTNVYQYLWESNSGRILVFGGPENHSGSYLQNDRKIESSSVVRPFPLRLIVHHSNGGGTRLLQRVFYGTGLGSNEVVATTQTALHPSAFSSARRISASHLPFSAGNPGWRFEGQMGLGQMMSVSVPLAYDDQAANPFLHTYHTDHDNLDASFERQRPRGVESYDIQRTITLQFNPAGGDFNSQTAGPQILSGNYLEEIKFVGMDVKGPGNTIISTNSRSYNVSGFFALRRINSIPTLTTAP